MLFLYSQCDFNQFDLLLNSGETKEFDIINAAAVFLLRTVLNKVIYFTGILKKWNNIQLEEFLNINTKALRCT